MLQRTLIRKLILLDPKLISASCFLNLVVFTLILHINSTTSQNISKSDNEMRNYLKSLGILSNPFKYPFTYDGFYLKSSDSKKINEEKSQTKLKEGIFINTNCTKSGVLDFPPDLFTLEEKLNGWLAVHFIASIYIFYAILIICEEYFVPSVECICKELNISSDLAGATFMAISTSAPELFTSIIGTFITKGDIGVGTIVGSAVFNIFAVGACCGIGLKFFKIKNESSTTTQKSIDLEFWPLTRDCFFYSFSIVLLLLVLYDRKVYWYEALTLLIFYLLYILVICNNGFFEKIVRKCFCLTNIKHSRKELEKRLSFSVPEKYIEKALEKTPLLQIEDLVKMKEVENENVSVYKYDYLDSSSPEYYFKNNVSTSTHYIDEVLLKAAFAEAESKCIEENESSKFFSLPPIRNSRTILKWAISWPIRFVFALTIPDCRNENLRKFYPITLLVSVFWIALFSYVSSWMMTIIGDTLSIPDSVTGLTFLAAGTSAPEVISSVIVARQGLGSMGLSNSVGSNIFDLLICLGLPWLIQTSILSFSASETDSFIKINSGGLEYSVGLLITSLILFYFFIAINGFKLDFKIGVVSVITYAIFLTVAICFELNLFFPVNLPTCTH